MSAPQGQRPLTVLQKCTNKHVVVRLKNDTEYKGKLDSIDMYMNLIMTDAKETFQNKPVANYSRAILRGNNVLLIKLENDL